MSKTRDVVASVLVVDDSEVQREHVATLCRELGVSRVDEVSGGEQALERLRALQAPPQAVIVDLEMPGMDGIELIEAMYRLGHLLPLVVVSAHEGALIHTVEALAREIGMPVLAALRKPIAAEVLADVLRRDDFPQSPRAAPVALPPAEDLARAIGHGDIAVHFQPKVCVRTGLLRGVEALARWRHPQAGDVPAGRFVELAEARGLIRELSFAVIETALGHLAHWCSRGLRLSLALNLSPRLLTVTDLVAELVARVREHGLEPSQVVLELTESSVVAAYDGGIGVLTRLRLKGFGLSIDDYGTGYASMSQLARIPFSELKVDRQFVHDASERHAQRMLLESALETARRFELVSVAEGVEREADWRLLQSLGCDVAQGYLIARPMAAEALQPWLRNHQTRLAELRSPASPGAL
ncbi:EAL domain-containing response regulator [Rubrivivax benzoatilyticus]|uniref:EAL domain-containing response regulator n=1 Tax=Rubrivivax benzoatilyticus TaxID=316997 RepID=A0ABX0HZD1_9BURK|nr:EAL domain-containing protein [Rubrivivax benzoatilyticus]EGJ11457.1 response regulator receiver modulated diguanylate phosphodiesterase [Rubrivivax benzoatilyticus JA2 = ATCC BAA-35]NHK99760.1 EAL domain-containing response regulator [Rubrivivax benzoatilyticus]NHL25633.1 EAL domain-containing response regulator [Rubrivivax benzoatilyticus]